MYVSRVEETVVSRESIYIHNKTLAMTLLTNILLWHIYLLLKEIKSSSAKPNCTHDDPMSGGWVSECLGSNVAMSVIWRKKNPLECMLCVNMLQVGWSLLFYLLLIHWNGLLEASIELSHPNHYTCQLVNVLWHSAEHLVRKIPLCCALTLNWSWVYSSWSRCST